MKTIGVKSGDYHDDMNYQNFSTWLKNMLLPNLPPNSVVILDNASYHNKQCNRAPTMSSRKDEMVTWLRANNIQFPAAYLKPELYELIKQHKKPLVLYSIDGLIRHAGHDVLRLPPYHPDLNPIEMVWATMKQHVAARNITLKLNDVKQLAIEAFDTISTASWKDRCEHVKKIETNYAETDLRFDNITQNIRMQFSVGVDSSASDSSGATSEEDSDKEE